MKTSKKEGFILSRGHKVWYCIVEASNKHPQKLPLLILHGGPGVPHDYLESLEVIAKSGRPVIFYDQLGCGNSDKPNDPSLWTIEYFIEEINTIRKALNLDNIHLLGQSWGGMLGMEYALTTPLGINSLIISNSPASTSQWMKEANRLRCVLPQDIQKILLKNENQETTDSLEYQQAMEVYYQKHLCRLSPWPKCLSLAFTKLEQNPEVYNTMWGTSEFHATGTLKNWDITKQLHNIHKPTLVLGGRYDEATPNITKTIQDGIPGAKRRIFEKSAHLPHLEEPKKYIQVVNEFLSQTEHSV